MELLPGYMVGASVRLERDLGAGRLGWSWSARDLTLDREVVVQILPPALADDLDVVECFMLEAQGAAKIDSPHVPRVLHIGVTPDRLPYVVTERLRGESLASRVLHAGPLEAREVAAVVHQTANALAAAHAVGILHRGLVPARIMLCGPGAKIDVKVLDFDIANEHQHPVTSRRGMTPRVAASMSPEQLLAPDDIDARADVWSLAVVAYYALTGEMPFSGDNYPALFMAVDRADFRPPSQLRAGVTAGVDAFFVRAFARGLDERFVSVNELDDAFYASVHEEGEDWPFSIRPGAYLAASDAPIALDYEDPNDELRDRRKRARRAWRRFALPLVAVVGAFAGAAAIMQFGQDGLRNVVAGGEPMSITTAAADAIAAVPPDLILNEVDPPKATAVVDVPPTRPARKTRVWQPRIDKIDDTPVHKEAAPVVRDNPYADTPAPKAPKAATSRDEIGF